MIVSASYRSDIPAFWPGWFAATLAAGFAEVPNPYGGKPYRVELSQDAVDGFVFWTRNPAPFLPILDAVAARPTPFMVQMTIIGYPRMIDRAVPSVDTQIALFQALANRFGVASVVWRYDPVLISDATPAAWHRAQIARIAADLDGSTDEVVLSFAQIYRKTLRHLEAAGRRHGFAWTDPDPDEKRRMLGDLAGIAAEHGIRASLCSQPDLLGPGLHAARCIDADRLSRVADRMIPARIKGNRPGCPCAESCDIGVYDSCAHACVYCYAVKDPTAARRLVASQAALGERMDRFTPSC